MKEKNVVEIFIEREKSNIIYDLNYYKSKKEAIESAIDVLKFILRKEK